MKNLKLMVLVFVIATGFSSKAQSFQIGHVQLTFTDPARSGRSIQTEIYYPAVSAGTGASVSPGVFPLVVFGHGFVMSWDAYQNVWDDLVPKGYIVVFPKTEGSFSPNHGEFGKDLAFLNLKLQDESSSNPSSIFYAHVSSKSAIMGHSMGGGSSFLAAENNTDITTMISFAAANTTPSSIDAAKHVSVPSLVFSGENDCVAPAGQHQIPMYDSLVASCKTFVNIKGAAHCEFANYNFNCSFGQSTCSPAPAITGAQQKDVVSDLLGLWLAYYLKEDCNAISYFNDSLASSPRITSEQSCPDYIAPVISQSGGVLQSTPATTYQWYLNGSAIVGANAQTYSYSGPGSYSVEVTYTGTCVFLSNTINITSTGITLMENGIFLNLTPSLAKDQLNIWIRSDKDRIETICVLDVLGHCILKREVAFIAGKEEKVQLDISDFSKGLYFVQLASGPGTRKFIKQ